MFFKKIMKILRGSATPAQMMMACVLGACIGFMPGFVQAPGLILALTLLLIVLNANLALAAMVLAGAKLLSLVFMPMSFGVGRSLLDGPTQGFFKMLINTPVLALFGFEYYATTGGLVLGLILGVIAGVVLIKAVKGIRSGMAKLEEGSELYKTWMAKWWVKLLLIIFVGKGTKESYSSLLEKKGKVIRPIGVVFCVLTLVLLVTVQMFFAGPFITSALQRGIEQANGATVNLENADVDLAQGRMTITGLAMTDPNALDTDLFRAATIEADISATSLLSKQLKLDRVVISDASNGAKRSTPGKIVGNKPAPTENITTEAGEKTLDDYLQNPKQWQQRLSQIQRWFDTLSGPSTDDKEQGEKAQGESLRERLEREVQAMGYARVAANHLIDDAPTFSIAELVAEKVQTDAFNGETIDIHANNISTQPYLLSEAPTATIKSSGETANLALALGAVSAGGGENTISFEYRGLPVDQIAGNLKAGDNKPIAGGTMDLKLNGSVTTSGGTYIDLPMEVTLNNTNISIGGRSAPVDRLMIPLGLRGPIDNPRILLDDSRLADALVAAGADALAGEVRGRADKLIKEAVSDVNLKDGIPKLDLKKGLPDFGGQSKSKDEKKDDAKKKDDDLRDKAKDLTKGLFGGKKKGG